MSNENNMECGVLYRSALSGLFYENRASAGDVDAVMIDGKIISEIDNQNRIISQCIATINKCEKRGMLIHIDEAVGALIRLKDK